MKDSSSDPLPEKFDKWTQWMARRCEHCILCRQAREKPNTVFSKVMHWHGTWCPFWKARQKVYENQG